MRISSDEVFYEDILWFATNQNGDILAFTSGVNGNVPEFVCESRENADILEDYFLHHQKKITNVKEMIDLSMKSPSYQKFCYDLARKGIRYYDAVIDTSYYTEICSPEIALSIRDIPTYISKILSKQIILTNFPNKEIKIIGAYGIW